MTQKSLPKVFIVGESGTPGLRLHDRLSGRKDIDLLSLPEDKKKDIDTIVSFAKEADIMFLCLPDDASREIVKATEGTGIRILDTSTAHRTKEDWVYGFPELSEQQKDAIAKADKVAVPGCHASGVISILYPLVKAGVLPINYPLHCFSLTGYSGGGKSMIKDYEENMREELKAPRQYGLSQKHKHLPEIMKVCKLCEEPLFSPSASRPISCSSPADFPDPSTSTISMKSTNAATKVPISSKFLTLPPTKRTVSSSMRTRMPAKTASPSTSQEATIAFSSSPLLTTSAKALPELPSNA